MKLRYKIGLAAAAVGLVSALGITSAFADDPRPSHTAIVLQSVNGNGCIDLDIASPRTDNPPAQLWGCHFGDNQAMYIEQGPGGVFYVVPVRDRSKCLAADLSTPAGNGQRLAFTTCSGDPSQQWQNVGIQREGYRLVGMTNVGASQATGRTMVIDRNPGDPSGRDMYLWELWGGDNQAFITYTARFQTSDCTSTPQCTFQADEVTIPTDD